MHGSPRNWKGPIKTGWAETDKGQPGKPNVRARWVAKEYKSHARPELYASTPLLVATGEREGKVLALVDVRRAYFNAPARRKVFVELPPEDYQLGDEHMCGLLRHSLCGTRDAAQNWEGGTGIDAQRSGIDEGKRVPMRVERPHQGEGRRGNCARRRHHNRWATDGRGVPHQDDIQKSMRSGNKTQTSRRVGEYSTVSLNGIATASQLRQIRGMSER